MNLPEIPPGAVARAHVHVGFDVMLYILQGKVRHECGDDLRESVDNERATLSSSRSSSRPASRDRCHPLRCASKGSPARLSKWLASFSAYSPLASNDFRPLVRRCALWLVVVLLGNGSTARASATLPFDDDLETGALCYQWSSALTPEICNGVDDDCNFSTDEGDPGGGEECTTGKDGVCSAGMTKCSDGDLICVQNVEPSPEKCDSFDNDCDGVVDEGYEAKGSPCSDDGVGACQGTGTFYCTGDGLGLFCSITDPGKPPTPEQCDGIDNDCNGIVDDGCPPP